MIKAVELQNFKAFRRLSIGLSPLTLLSGVNAAGKSTVMQALALLRQSYDSGTLAEFGLLLNGEMVELGTGQDVVHEDYEVAETADYPVVAIRLDFDEARYACEAEYVLSRDREADLLTIRSETLQEMAGISLFDKGFQYLRADRITPSLYYPKSYDIAVRRSFLGSRGEHAINFLRVHQDEDVASESVRHPHAKSLNIIDQVTAWMDELCPGVDLRSEDLEGTDLVRLSYGFGGTAGISSSNIRYRPTNVGFGLTYVLPVIVACLTAKPGILLLLENPEAHLHPRAQSVMARLICEVANAGAQVVIESHSDHFLNGVRIAVRSGTLVPADTAIHYFNRSAGAIEVTTPEIGLDGMLSLWPSGFFDEWDNAIDRLLD